MDRFLGLSKSAVFLLFFFFLFTFYFLSKPSRTFAACSCDFDSAAGKFFCSSECGVAFSGKDCTADRLNACRTADNAAQCTQIDPSNVWLETFQTCANFQDFLNIVVIWGLLIATALALIRLVSGGLQFIYASGDPKALEEARATLSSAILGLILIVCSFLITKFIQGSLPTNWLIWFGVNP